MKSVSQRLHLLLPFSIGVLTTWPLWENAAAFRTLFYFQDEWDLIDLWDKIGFWPWVSTTFAENFVPLFKFCWGGAIVVFDGNYFALIILLWLGHALNVWLVTRITLRIGGSPAGAALAGLVFGLAWVNFETLTWTVQWSAVLSLSFSLLAIDHISCWSESEPPSTCRTSLILGLCVLGSSLCFSRGVLTGPALCIWVLFSSNYAGRWKSKSVIFAATLLPAAAVACWIFTHTSGNQHHIAGAGTRMLEFALYYFAQSPLRTLWSDIIPSLGWIFCLAALKLTIFGAGLWLAPRRLRPALATLCVFEVGNALLLGLGRYHTGLPASASSRYQYVALATLAPFVGVIFGRICTPLLRWRWVGTGVAFGVVALIAMSVASPWRRVMRAWAPGRGAILRHQLFEIPPAEAPANFTQLPWMSNDRAREIARNHHLH